MTDVIAFDVELTENQKMAQHKLYQVHQLYDEIEKLLGAQDIFNKPHLVMVLPNKLKKEPLTNEEWFNGLSTEQKARWLYEHYVYARADEYYGRQEKTLYEYQKWLVSVHKGIDGTKID